MQRRGLGADEAACCVAAAFKVDQGDVFDRAVALDCARDALGLGRC